MLYCKSELRIGGIWSPRRPSSMRWLNAASVSSSQAMAPGRYAVSLSQVVFARIVTGLPFEYSEQGKVQRCNVRALIRPETSLEPAGRHAHRSSRRFEDAELTVLVPSNAAFPPSCGTHRGSACQQGRSRSGAHAPMPPGSFCEHLRMHLHPNACACTFLPSSCLTVCWTCCMDTGNLCYTSLHTDDLEVLNAYMDTTTSTFKQLSFAQEDTQASVSQC